LGVTHIEALRVAQYSFLVVGMIMLSGRAAGVSANHTFHIRKLGLAILVHDGCPHTPTTLGGSVLRPSSPHHILLLSKMISRFAKSLSLIVFAMVSTATTNFREMLKARIFISLH
jgi:hypothetical protein